MFTIWLTPLTYLCWVKCWTDLSVQKRTASHSMRTVLDSDIVFKIDSSWQWRVVSLKTNFTNHNGKPKHNPQNPQDFKFKSTEHVEWALNTLSVLNTPFLCFSPLSPHNQFQELACCFLFQSRPHSIALSNVHLQQASSVSSMQGCGVGSCGVPMCKRGIN